MSETKYLAGLSEFRHPIARAHTVHECIGVDLYYHYLEKYRLQQLRSTLRSNIGPRLWM